MSIEENPYEAPKTVDRVVGIRSGRREDLRSVAFYQKAIMVCILGYLFCLAAQVVLQVAVAGSVQQLGSVVVGLLAVGVVLAGVVFTFLLAMKVYNIGVGILLGIFTFIPCIGLLILLAVSSKATGILRENGIKVGFLGADLSQI